MKICDNRTTNFQNIENFRFIGVKNIIVIDKNLLSKQTAQETTDEIFAPLKANLPKVISKYENLVQNEQDYIMQTIDDCVTERSQYANSVANVENNFVFKVEFHENSRYDLDLYANTSHGGIDYYINPNYYYRFDTNLVDMYHIPTSEHANLVKRCKKYLNNAFPTIGDIEAISYDNAFKIQFNTNDYLVKAANDFSRFVVAYLAKQGIKSRASQSNNKVTVVIERDTNTGGFEDI